MSDHIYGVKFPQNPQKGTWLFNRKPFRRKIKMSITWKRSKWNFHTLMILPTILNVCSLKWHNYNSKMADGRHLGFWKNSHNFVQDWGIRLKFCTLVQNSTINWSTWPKMSHDQNSRWRRLSFRISSIWKLTLKYIAWPIPIYCLLRYADVRGALTSFKHRSLIEKQQTLMQKLQFIHMLTATDVRKSKTAKILKKVILLYCCTLTYEDVQRYSNITFLIFAVFDVRTSVAVNTLTCVWTVVFFALIVH